MSAAADAVPAAAASKKPSASSKKPSASKMYFKFPGTTTALELKWYKPKVVDFLVESRLAAQAGYDMPCKTLKPAPDGCGPPPGQDRRTWAKTMIYREHPLMAMLAHHKDPIRAVWYDDIVRVLVEANVIKSVYVAGRRLVTVFNLFKSTNFPWLPKLSMKLALPSAERSTRDKERRAKGYKTEKRQIFPLFLMPFLRVLFKGPGVAAYDAYLVSQSGILLGMIRNIPSAALVHENSQFVMNMDMATRHTSLKIALTETQALRVRTDALEVKARRYDSLITKQTLLLNKHAAMFTKQATVMAKLVKANKRAKKRRASSAPDGEAERLSKRERKD